MGCCGKVIDTLLVLYFALIAIGAPALHTQLVLPTEIFSEFLIKLKLWYIQVSGDYLFVEKPDFFIGIVWLNLLFNWPLAIASIYGILGRKAWLPNTLLIAGVSTFVALVPVVADLMLSGKASDRLLLVYGTVTACAVLAILRASVALCGDVKAGTTAVGRKLGSKDKKKA